MQKPSKLSASDKRQLRNKLYERDGTKCHYCEIEEAEFCGIWGDTFYGGIKRGRKLEIDRIDNDGEYSLDNCVLACALCNMAKSDKFTYEEFKGIGVAIEKIWRTRKKLTVTI